MHAAESEHSAVCEKRNTFYLLTIRFLFEFAEVRQNCREETLNRTEGPVSLLLHL